MTPDDFKRIRELYEQALTMSESDFSAFLDRECAGTPPIRAEVERLLNAHARIPSWLNHPAVAAA